MGRIDRQDTTTQADRATASDRGGFTLLELMITLALIGILASIAVPSYFASRINASESAVVSTLRSIVTAETEFKAAAVVDLNGDGAYEFGGLREMAGAAPLRGTTTPLQPPLLSPRMGLVDDTTGLLTVRGYYIAVYLPDAAGVGLRETAANQVNIDPSRADDSWTAIAWPIRYGVTGNFTYYVSAQGEIVKNRGANYSGLANPPAAGAALVGATSADHIDSTQVAVNTTGADGSVWVPVQ